ncbi:MAG: carboxypeptidase-like regulatory domain-containing protein, partial [Saprospiraceae bacterium]
MLKTLLMTLALSMTAGILAAQTVLQGKVTDDKGEELIGATVRVLKGTDFVRGAATDAFGNFRIQLDPGTYNVEVTYSGVAMSR